MKMDGYDIKQSLALPKENQFKKGGKIKKTGKALVHKGEEILTKRQAKNPIIKKAIRNAKKQ